MNTNDPSAMQNRTVQKIGYHVPPSAPSGMDRMGDAAAKLVTVGILIPPLSWIGAILGIISGTKSGKRAFWCGLLLIPIHLAFLKWWSMQD